VVVTTSLYLRTDSSQRFGCIWRGSAAPHYRTALPHRTLEHLDDAVLNQGHLAEGGDDPSVNRSLRRLPGGYLAIAIGGKLFGILSLDELEAIAREQFDRMEEEAFASEDASIEAAIDSYVDDMIAARRELR
jgi:hypothetical protein